MGTSIYDMFETDATLETEGVWIDYGKEVGKFLIARSGGANTKFAQVLEVKMRPHRRQMDHGKLATDIAEKVLRETFVDACLITWNGIRGKDGREIPYSKEAALKLFTDLPDLFSDLREQSNSMAIFQQEQVEGDSGN